MADDQDKGQKTEDATPQRLRKAREDGQIAYSAEFVGGMLMLAAALIAWLSAWGFFAALGSGTSHRLSNFEREIQDPRLLVAALIESVQFVGFHLLALLIPITIAAAVSGVMQTGFNFSTKPLELDWSKLSVTKGFGRMFSSKGLVRGGLSLCKAAMITAVIVWVIYSNTIDISLASFAGVPAMMSRAWDMIVQAWMGVAMVLLVVGGIDLVYQHWKHKQDLQMSIKDIKDENKETEGDPMIRARLKKLQMEMGRKRMLSAVPEATVVITNPTHFAVALRYDRETMASPIVVAKGADHLARKIIEIANENSVAVVERKPVARFLYANVEPGHPIPFELYQAVAEILNFVNRMRSSV